MSTMSTIDHGKDGVVNSQEQPTSLSQQELWPQIALGEKVVVD